MSRKEFLEELEELSVKELVQKRKEMRKELFSLRMKNFGGSLKDNSQIRKTRRNIARINTVLTHKIKVTYGTNMK